MEVADTSLAEDRGIKAQTYARDTIAEYWIVDYATGSDEPAWYAKVQAPSTGTYTIGLGDGAPAGSARTFSIVRATGDARAWMADAQQKDEAGGGGGSLPRSMSRLRC